VEKRNLFVDIVLVDVCDEVDAHGVLFDKTNGGGRRGEDVGARRRRCWGGLWTSRGS